MRFYKLTGKLIKGIGADGGEEERRAAETAIVARTKEFNGREKGIAYALAEMTEDSVTVCLISAENAAPTRPATDYTSFIGLEVTDLTQTEVTLSDVKELLVKAMRNEYVEDDDEILESFHLDHIGGSYCYSLQYGENLAEENAERNELIASAKKYAMNETLIPELRRVYLGKKQSAAIGHPVHYTVETDDRDSRREVCRILIGALYANKRIAIPRYAFTDLNEGDSYSKEPFEALYKLSDGGTVIIRYVANGSASDRDTAKDERKTVEAICDVIKRYKNKVLTVLCFPQKCGRIRKLFGEMLSGMSFVGICDDGIKGSRIRARLNALAKSHGVKPDGELYGAIDTEKVYVSSELNVIFDGWYAKKLKSAVYPQYRNVATVQTGRDGGAPVGEAYGELMGMIGLTETKQMIGKALNYYKMQKLYAEHGIKNGKPAMHMCFSGSPGTAKTTVARLFAGIMRDNGLLSSGHLVEVGRGDLVGKYTGWTAQTVSAKFREAAGGVLFIDEAYSLVDDREGSYGDEAIHTIVQEMENNRADTVVILAGYKDKMEELFRHNPGLRSRIAFHVPFSDYTAEELCGIAELIIGKSGMRFADGALDKLRRAFDVAAESDDFGNGRYVRNLLEQAKMNQASRLLAKDFGSITAEEVALITAEDIDVPRTKRAKSLRIGFCDYDVAV